MPIVYFLVEDYELQAGGRRVPLPWVRLWVWWGGNLFYWSTGFNPYLVKFFGNPIYVQNYLLIS